MSSPPPTQGRPRQLGPEDRPRTRTDVLIVLGSVFRDQVEADPRILRTWAKDPALMAIKGFRVKLIGDAAELLKDVSPPDLPAALSRELRRIAKLVGRDAGGVLEGRPLLRGSAPRRPLDTEIHRRIGSTQRDA